MLKIGNTYTLETDVHFDVILDENTHRGGVTVRKGTRVRIDDYFQGEYKIATLSEPFIFAWVKPETLQVAADLGCEFASESLT